MRYISFLLFIIVCSCGDSPLASDKEIEEPIVAATFLDSISGQWNSEYTILNVNFRDGYNFGEGGSYFAESVRTISSDTSWTRAGSYTISNRTLSISSTYVDNSGEYLSDFSYEVTSVTGDSLHIQVTEGDEGGPLSLGR